MREELELKLAEEFEWMQPNPNTNQGSYIEDLYKAFGCECGDGWYDLLRNLCREITDVYAKRGLKVDIEPQQIKEKYGTLRFYYGYRWCEDGNPRDSELLKEIDDEIYKIVCKYEDISEETCELCGNKGELRTDGWVQCRCDNCDKERIQRIEDFVKNHK